MHVICNATCILSSILFFYFIITGCSCCCCMCCCVTVVVVYRESLLNCEIQLHCAICVRLLLLLLQRVAVLLYIDAAMLLNVREWRRTGNSSGVEGWNWQQQVVTRPDDVIVTMVEVMFPSQLHLITAELSWDTWHELAQLSIRDQGHNISTLHLQFHLNYSHQHNKIAIK